MKIYNNNTLVFVFLSLLLESTIVRIEEKSTCASSATVVRVTHAKVGVCFKALNLNGSAIDYYYNYQLIGGVMAQTSYNDSTCTTPSVIPDTFFNNNGVLVESTLFAATVGECSDGVTVTTLGDEEVLLPVAGYYFYEISMDTSCAKYAPNNIQVILLPSTCARSDLMIKKSFSIDTNSTPNIQSGPNCATYSKPATSMDTCTKTHFSFKLYVPVPAFVPTVTNTYNGPSGLKLVLGATPYTSIIPRFNLNMVDAGGVSVGACGLTNVPAVMTCTATYSTYPIQFKVEAYGSSTATVSTLSSFIDIPTLAASIQTSTITTSNFYFLITVDTGVSAKYFMNNNEFTCASVVTACKIPNQSVTASGAPVNLTIYAVKNNILSKQFVYTTPLPASVKLTDIDTAGIITYNSIPVKPVYTGGSVDTLGMKVFYQSSLLQVEASGCVQPTGLVPYVCDLTTPTYVLDQYSYYRVRMVMDDGFSQSTQRKLFLTQHAYTNVKINSISPTDLVVTGQYTLQTGVPTTVTYKLNGGIVCQSVVYGSPCTMSGLNIASAYSLDMEFFNAQSVTLQTSPTATLKTQQWTDTVLTPGSYSGTALSVTFNTPSILPLNFTVVYNDAILTACKNMNNPGNSASCNIPVSYLGFHKVVVNSQSNTFSVFTLDRYLPNFAQPTVSINWFTEYTLFTISPSQNAFGLLHGLSLTGYPTTLQNGNVVNITTTLGTPYTYFAKISQVNVPPTVFLQSTNTFNTLILQLSAFSTTPSVNSVSVSYGSTGGCPIGNSGAGSKYYISLNGQQSIGCWGVGGATCAIGTLTANTTYEYSVSVVNNDQQKDGAISTFKTLPKPFTVVPTITTFATGFVVEAVTSPVLVGSIQTFVLVDGQDKCTSLPCEIRNLSPQTQYSVQVVMYSVADNTYQTTTTPATTRGIMDATFSAAVYNPALGSVQVTLASLTGSNPTAAKTYTFKYQDAVQCNGVSGICAITANQSEIIDVMITIQNQIDSFEFGFSVSTYVLTQTIEYLALSRTIYFSAVPSQIVPARFPLFDYQVTGVSDLENSDNPDYSMMALVSESTTYTVSAQYLFQGTYNQINLISSQIVVTSYPSINFPAGQMVTLVSLNDTHLSVKYAAQYGAPTTTTLYSIKLNGVSVPQCQQTPATQCTMEVSIGYFVIFVHAENEIDIEYGNPNLPFNNIQLTSSITYITSSSFQVSFVSNYIFNSYRVWYTSTFYKTFQVNELVGTVVVTGLTLNTTYAVRFQGIDVTGNMFPTPQTDVTTSYPFSLTRLYLISNTPTTATVAYGLIDGGSLPIVYSVHVDGDFVFNTTGYTATVQTGGNDIDIVVVGHYYEDNAQSEIAVHSDSVIDGIQINTNKIDINYVNFVFTTLVPLKNVQYSLLLNNAMTLNCQIGQSCSATGLKEQSVNTITVTGNYNNNEWAPTKVTTFTTYSKVKSVVINSATTDSSANKLYVTVTSVGGDFANTEYSIYNGLNKLVTSTSPNSIAVPLIKSYPWYQLRAIANYSTSSASSPVFNYVALSFNIVVSGVTSNIAQISANPTYNLDPNIWTLSYELNGQQVVGCVLSTCVIDTLVPLTDYLLTVTASQTLGKVSRTTTFKTLDAFKIPSVVVTDYSATWIQVSYAATGGDANTAVSYAVTLDGAARVDCPPTLSTCNITELVPQVTYNLGVTATRGSLSASFVRQFTLPNGAAIAINTAQVMTTSAVLSYPLRAVLSDTPITYLTTLDGAATKCDVLESACQLTQLQPNKTYNFVVTATYLVDKTITTQVAFTTYPSINSPKINIVQLTTTTIVVNLTVTGGAPTVDTVTQLFVNGVNTQCLNNLCVFSGLAPATTFVFRAVTSNDGVTRETILPITTYPIISLTNFEPYQRNETGIYVDIVTAGGVPGQTVWTVSVNDAVLCDHLTPANCYKPISSLDAFTYRLDLANDGTSLNRVVNFQTYPIPEGVIIASQTNTTQQSIAFTWSTSSTGGVPGATYYEAQLSYDNKTWGSACVSTTTSCTVNKLVDSTGYNVRIAVRNRRFDPIISPQIVLVTNSSGPVTCALTCLNNGTCQSGYCVCIKGYDGPQCEFNMGGNSTTGGSPPEFSKLAVNPNNTEVSIENKYVTLSFSMQSITEVDVNGTVVEQVDLSTTLWKLILNNESTVIHPTTQEELTELLFGYVSDDGLLSVNFSQYIPSANSNAALTVDSYPVTFAGETFNVKLGSLKYSFRVQGWEFNSTENTLHVASFVGDIGNDTQVTFNDGAVMSSLVMVDNLGNQVYSRLINRVLVDNFPMRVSHYITPATNGTLVTTVIPSFIESFVYDPDISVLVYDRKETTEDPIDKKSWTAVIVGVTVGVVCAAIIAAGVIYYLKKHKYQVKSFKSRFSRSVSLKEWSRHR
ncbi:hypothetical protein DFA_02461 [Cavenderia fasciculata]|uniref:Fibronectin type-III domain-containing protein n=1 Tax=Cavenderia fasciculata TaxID=261658 RepID=F4PZI4_CACFS|nr:uncharacterized protein DFA_02461 [Cavenderia fasciculata]EGG19213.1 hypothetical protein DFA_02461 [Cavenderia fasciculata]|eukprot:XP_004366846.1 hypothetical protein DFA_02461 [Cavenderia fasciculata]